MAVQILMCLSVSIHTPNEGSDIDAALQLILGLAFQSTLPMKGVTQRCGRAGGSLGVSIHTPNEGSDVDPAGNIKPDKEFQSTLSMKGVTQIT